MCTQIAKSEICIVNSMISSDIWHKFHKWYFKIVIGITAREIWDNFAISTACEIWDNFEISQVYLCQISRTNRAIICLYYYLQKVCNFHM